MLPVTLSAGTAFLTTKALLDLPQYLETRGIDHVAFGKKNDLDWAASNQRNAYLPFRTFVAALERAAVEAGDEAFALKYALGQPQNCSDLFHHIQCNAETLRASLIARAKYSRLVTNAYHPAVTMRGSELIYSWNFPDRPAELRQISDYLIGLLIGRVRVLLRDPEWKPLRIAAPNSAASSLEILSSIDASLEVGMTESGHVVFDHESLDRRLPDADPQLYAELVSTAANILGLEPEPEDFLAAVRERISRGLSTEAASEEAVARSLELSVRSLQRQLAQSKTTFQELSQQVRCETALRLITQTAIDFADVAFLVGYSEQSAFTRAVKSWFNMTPTELRKRAKKIM